ncbi:MAG: hypothetical protein JXB88_18375, partial [Spirochaetales bacterium]|nr:hypothetical protein [Spirochaetales bacterium]
ILPGSDVITGINYFLLLLIWVVGVANAVESMKSKVSKKSRYRVCILTRKNLAIQAKPDIIKAKMGKGNSNTTDSGSRVYKLKKELQVLTQQISSYSLRDFVRVEFLKCISEMLRNISGCDEIELWLLNWDKQQGFEIIRHTKQSFFFEMSAVTLDRTRHLVSYSETDTDFERLCKNIINGHFNPALPFFTDKGTFWTGNPGHFIKSEEKDKEQIHYNTFIHNNGCLSLVIIPLIIDKERIGLFQLKDCKESFFTKKEIDLYENFSQTLGVSLINQQTHAALRERVKELTCMYGIAQSTGLGISINEIMQNTAELLPQAWQYPDIAHARIVLDGDSYTNRNFVAGHQKQSADIMVNSEKRGVVEITYAEERIKIDEGPFLKEERNLIDNVAKALSLVIEQKQTEKDKERLQEQIRHADRLATIGQLAAGVAHELNEPLGNILGFAQLIRKHENLPQQIEQDLEKIINASLHAREIVRKLLIFARQMPTKKSRVNLNQLVEDGLYFLQSRCAKEGVRLTRLLDKSLPDIFVDSSQVTQVLVNLVVNSVQAMPGGGEVTVQTFASGDHVVLIIKDTGEGMNEQTLKQIFLPFFTTKGIGQGTGLGLAVVHGIVLSHGGTIKVESEVGRGSRFEISLPSVK